VFALLYVVPVGVFAAVLVLFGLWQVAVGLVAVEIVVSTLLFRFRRQQAALEPSDEPDGSLPYLLRPSSGSKMSPIRPLLAMMGVVVVLAVAAELITHR
jgi:hypothetical protein